jgi:hypothetical protein
MELNPYESPRVPQPGQERELADSNSIRQLLVEIRDGQRELLQLQREALKAQTAWKRFGAMRMLVPLLVFGAVFGTSFYLRTTLSRPPPFPTAPRVAPAPPVVAPRPARIPRVAPQRNTAEQPPNDSAAD